MDKLIRAAATGLCAMVAAVTVARAGDVAPEAIVVVGDAIPSPLTPAAGDAARGKTIVLDRANGNCLICHRLPVPGELFQGEIGPDLGGVGQRLSAGQLRLRLVDQTRINPATVMPPYYRVAGLERVDPRYRGKPALKAEEIEDVVAYLATLGD